MDSRPPPASSSIASAVLDDTETQLLLTKLHRSLPYAVPLYRRIQFHLHHPNPPHAHVFVAVATSSAGGRSAASNLDQSHAQEASSTSLVSSWLRSESPIQNGEKDGTDLSGDDTAEAWLAAHIDLSTAGQTQVWIYASWEPFLPYHTATSPSRTMSPDLPSGAIPKSLFSALTNYIRTHLIPQQPTSPPPQWLSLVEAKKIITTPYNRSKVLFGSIHESAIASLIPKHMRSRADPGYLVYIFWLRPPNTPPLPKDFTFQALQPQHLQTVLDRSSIPRTLQSLRQYVSVGLYHTAQNPVGWAFLGKDASLTSLHTEPEYRGRGFGVAVARATFELQRSVFSDRQHDETQCSYACVGQDNTTSRRVMEKLGGQVMWKACWVEFDLDLL